MDAWQPLPEIVKRHARALRQNQPDAETCLWYFLRGRRFGGFEFRRQHPVPPYILDFYCHAKRLAIEFDGGQHSERTRYDRRRTQFLETQGIRVIRFWNNDVLQQTEIVLEALWQELHWRPLTPRPPLPTGEGV